MKKHLNIADLFELVADVIPEREALVCGNSRSTFAELEERANQMAHVLTGKGVKAGDHVGLHLYNCNEYMEGMLACFKIRAVPINVNYRYVDEELLYMVNNADMVASIHHREFIPNIKAIQHNASGQFRPDRNYRFCWLQTTAVAVLEHRRVVFRPLLRPTAKTDPQREWSLSLPRERVRDLVPG